MDSKDTTKLPCLLLKLLQEKNGQTALDLAKKLGGFKHKSAVNSCLYTLAKTGQVTFHSQPPRWFLVSVTVPITQPRPSSPSSLSSLSSFASTSGSPTSSVSLDSTPTRLVPKPKPVPSLIEKECIQRRRDKDGSDCEEETQDVIAEQTMEKTAKVEKKHQPPLAQQQQQQQQLRPKPQYDEESVFDRYPDLSKTRQGATEQLHKVKTDDYDDYVLHEISNPGNDMDPEDK